MGAWAWDRLVPLLQEQGHRAIALDLPGRGDNPVPVAEQTLATYVATVVAAIDDCPDRVYLVGHSAGGMVVSQAAETRPQRVAGLIYIAAFMLADGQSLADIAADDTGNTILRNTVANADTTTLTIKSGQARDPLYHDCSDADVEWAQQRLVAEATEPSNAKVRLTTARYGTVPRYYLECLQDRAISITTQRALCAAQSPRRVISLDTSHSPFLCQPGTLAAHLHQIVSSE